MKTRRVLTIFLAGVMVVSLLCSSALGATSYDSASLNFAVSGQNYECWSMLTVDGSRFDASVFIRTSDYAKPGEGVMAAQARLYKASGTLIASSSKIESIANDWFVMAYTGRYGSSEGAAYSQGLVYVGDSFQITTKATNTYSTATLSASVQSNVVAAYAVAPNGETYGSALYADTLGNDPDLICAENAAGVTGYVRAEDLNDPDCGDSIPLYSLNGSAIGTFEIDPIPEYEDLPDDVQAVLDQLEYECENGIGLYPINSNGETYGANVLGYQPDLIAAIGDGDEFGYVRSKDLFNTSTYAFTAPKSFRIPLYDCEGTEIGTFTITNGTLSNSELQFALQRH